MIDQIKGIIIACESQVVSLLLHDAISFCLSVPNTTLYVVNQSVHFYVHFHWNQENGPTLYGFATNRDRQVFQLIISCSGIGPKIGLAVLQNMSASSFIGAIVTDNVQALSNVPGIGKKKAETIILHLKDKAAQLFDSGIIDAQEASSAQHLHEVAQALNSLHYTKQEVSAALDHVKKKEDLTSLPFDTILRKTLLFLSKRV